MRKPSVFYDRNQQGDFIIVSTFSRLMTIAIGFLLPVVMYAVDLKCSIPLIETSTGDFIVCAGVSTVSITASEGELISYTTDGSAPSEELADAVTWPVKFTVASSTKEVRAIALKEGMEPSDCADFKISHLTMKSYTDFSQMFMAKTTGVLTGPYLIYDVEMLEDGKSSWIMLCEPEIRNSLDCIIVEFSGDFYSAYPDLHEGETVDYIIIRGDSPYDGYSPYARNGGMHRVTSCEFPFKSVPLAGSQQVLQRLNTPPAYWEDYYRLPIVLEDVQVVDGVVYDLVVAHKFANVRLGFDENCRYNLRGFVSTDILDSHQALRFFVPGYENLGVRADEVASIGDAFDFEGESRTVVLSCDLTVVVINRERDHLFATDGQGNDIVLTGDFEDVELVPGDVISDFMATLTKTDGVFYGAIDAASLVSVDYSGPADPVNITVDKLSEYVGKHIQFESILDRSAAVISRAVDLPELRVGGVRLNPSAISDQTAEKIGYAVYDYEKDEKFKLRGMVMPDGQGDKEFWPIEILTKHGDVVTADIDVEVGDEVKIVDGRPSLTAGQEMHDLLGRPVDSTTASSGLYIIHTPTHTVKICLP